MVSENDHKALPGPAMQKIRYPLVKVRRLCPLLLLLSLPVAPFPLLFVLAVPRRWITFLVLSMPSSTISWRVTDPAIRTISTSWSPTGPVVPTTPP